MGSTASAQPGGSKGVEGVGVALVAATPFIDGDASCASLSCRGEKQRSRCFQHCRSYGSLELSEDFPATLQPDDKITNMLCSCMSLQNVMKMMNHNQPTHSQNGSYSCACRFIML